MNELKPNPERCTRFDQNPFKKEKCKNCGRSWWEHKGVISQELVDEFVCKRQKLLDDIRKKEEDAKQQARDKALAKKKNSQAVEDEWLFNCSKDELIQSIQPDSDDDADTGFRMFTPNNQDVSSSQFIMPKPPERPLKVVNFIDFSECNVQDAPQAAQVVNFIDFSECNVQDAPQAVQAPSPLQEHVSQSDLIAENQHLRQLLADAGKEKAIELAIVRDEVDEGQQLISTLQRERLEVERQLRETHEKLGQIESNLEALPQHASSNEAAAEVLLAETQQAIARQAENDLLRMDAERSTAEAVGLRAALAELVGERDEARFVADSQRQHCERESCEAEQLCLELEQQRSKRQVHNVELERLHAELNQHKSQAEFQDSQARQYRSEIGRLQASASRQAVPSSAVNATLAELREVSARAHEVLGDMSEGATRPLLSAAETVEEGVADTDTAATRGMEAELQSLQAAAKAVLSLAEQVGTERRLLSERRKERRQAQDAALAASVASFSTATVATDLTGQVHKAVPAIGVLPSSPNIAKQGSLLITADPLSQQEASRRTARALREIRGYAEQQLACISKRMCMSSLCNRHDDFARTLDDQEQEAGGVLTLGVALAAS